LCDDRDPWLSAETAGHRACDRCRTGASSGDGLRAGK
jgi:methylphosphotriester-DNA--protein-cysteine methyltransferase